MTQLWFKSLLVTYEMPNFPFAVVAEGLAARATAAAVIRQDADDRRGDGIGHLTDQQNNSG